MRAKKKKRKNECRKQKETQQIKWGSCGSTRRKSENAPPPPFFFPFNLLRMLLQTGTGTREKKTKKEKTGEKEEKKSHELNLAGANRGEKKKRRVFNGRRIWQLKKC